MKTIRFPVAIQSREALQTIALTSATHVHLTATNQSKTNTPSKRIANNTHTQGRLCFPFKMWKSTVLLTLLILLQLAGDVDAASQSDIFAVTALNKKAIDYSIIGSLSACACRVKCTVNASCTAVTVHMQDGIASCFFSNALVNQSHMIGNISSFTYVKRDPIIAQSASNAETTSRSTSAAGATTTLPPSSANVTTTSGDTNGTTTQPSQQSVTTTQTASGTNATTTQSSTAAGATTTLSSTAATVTTTQSTATTTQTTTIQATTTKVATTTTPLDFNVKYFIDVTFSNGHYILANGSAVPVDIWAFGEPALSQDQHCAVMDPAKNYKAATVSYNTEEEIICKLAN